MLSHLQESARSFPGLQQIAWGHLDNAGLHAAVSAIVRIHSTIQAMGGAGDGEALHIQHQLAALYAAADKAGAAGLSEEVLALTLAPDTSGPSRGEYSVCSPSASTSLSHLLPP